MEGPKGIYPAAMLRPMLKTRATRCPFNNKRVTLFVRHIIERATDVLKNEEYKKHVDPNPVMFLRKC